MESSKLSLLKPGRVLRAKRGEYPDSESHADQFKSVGVTEHAAGG